jgi:hypothetical protein
MFDGSDLRWHRTLAPLSYVAPVLSGGAGLAAETRSSRLAGLRTLKTMVGGSLLGAVGDG